MSALLNMNMLQYVSWKGKTFYQITSQIKKNQINKNENGSDTNVSTNRNYFIPGPNKIYRREIGEIATINPHHKTCSSRFSTSIDQLNMPNGYIVSETKNANAGIVNVLDIYSSTNKYENGLCIDKNVCASENARRRVRSSGMIHRKFKPENNNDNAYFTNSTQYLVSRNRTFTQNQYNHIRPTEPSLINTFSQANTNVYSPNGLSHCKMATITKGVNDTFYYLWTTFDTTDVNINTVKSNPDNAAIGSFKVVIPEGEYDIKSLNAVLQRVMSTNKHYYISNLYKNNEYLLNIIYNNVKNKVELQCFSNILVNNANNYSVPTGGTAIPTAAPYKIPVFYFPTDNTVLGFQTGFYPPVDTTLTNTSTVPVGILSNISHSVYPLYDIMHYKPNNTRFAVQGAVSSSDRVTRVKYDAITQSASSYRSVYGSEVANALAYGVPGKIYTIKDKYGYPNKKTPVFRKTYGPVGIEEGILNGNTGDTGPTGPRPPCECSSYGIRH
jgi:hypothetical protein